MTIYAPNQNKEYEKICSFSKHAGSFLYLNDKGKTEYSSNTWEIKDNQNQSIQILIFENNKKINTQKLMLILYQYKDKLKLSKYLTNKEDKLKIIALNPEEKAILEEQDEIFISFKDLIKNQKNQKRKDEK